MLLSTYYVFVGLTHYMKTSDLGGSSLWLVKQRTHNTNEDEAKDAFGCKLAQLAEKKGEEQHQWELGPEVDLPPPRWKMFVIQIVKIIWCIIFCSCEMKKIGIL